MSIPFLSDAQNDHCSNPQINMVSKHRQWTQWRVFINLEKKLKQAFNTFDHASLLDTFPYYGVDQNTYYRCFVDAQRMNGQFFYFNSNPIPPPPPPESLINAFFSSHSNYP